MAPNASGPLAEFDHEIATTRRLLALVPEGKAEFRPHAKSMTLGVLAAHIAGLTGFIQHILERDELDFLAGTWAPPPFTTTAALLESFDAGAARARAALETLTPERMGQPWTLRMGERVFFTMPRAGAHRVSGMNHFLHHRGQLSVYLRLLDVPLPPIYGPTADVTL